MTLHYKVANSLVRRHDLAFLSDEGWRTTLRSYPELAREPLVIEWARHGWPLVCRRPLPEERGGMALGMPLPPSAGKRRLAIVANRDEIVAIAPPMALRAAIRAAPRSWWRTMQQIGELAGRYAVDTRVFGSLAWHALTGLEYVTETSDLDLLFSVSSDTDLRRLTDDLFAIDITAPMRLDGELMRTDGAAVNWREVHSGTREILVKHADSVALIDASRFLCKRSQP
ncbi:MAG: malonate decarboxylase holo-[acyl-carrier-protein] synthase [Pseudomonadota bacterium]|nr:malonate decarboxylase holo-[acyl-carrier-protein] synthase [Pseudomonadota bacterium]